jgi:hypothetical protein
LTLVHPLFLSSAFSRYFLHLFYFALSFPFPQEPYYNYMRPSLSPPQTPHPPHKHLSRTSPPLLRHQTILPTRSGTTSPPNCFFSRHLIPHPLHPQPHFLSCSRQRRCPQPCISHPGQISDTGGAPCSRQGGISRGLDQHWTIARRCLA